MALPFGNYNFSIYLYESFSYTINKPITVPATTSLVTSNSAGLPTSYFDTSTGRVIFSSLSNAAVVGAQLFTITARDASSNITGLSSNNVTVGSGRFRDSNNSNLSGSNFTYYKNEPITSVQFRAPFVISTPTTVPTLPPGLSFVDISGGGWYELTGTPLVTVPQSNYLIIGRGTGSNTGKIVTTSNIGIVISNERLRLDVSGATIVSPMTVGTAIIRRDVMARFPPYPTNGALTYTWSGLPDGLVVRDIASNLKYSPFTIPNSNLDPSYTLFISGTPTSDAAEDFRLAGISSKTVTFLATRTSPLPAISNAVSFTFGFAETVLFTGSNIGRLYANNPLNPTANYFDARTAFGSTSNVSDISSTSLPAGLTIVFNAPQNRGYLTGTPTDPSSNTYTIRATNSNSVSTTLLQTIEVVNDTITFTSPTDTSYSFVLSRPLSNALTGYYPANIQFLATSASGNALSFATSDLTGTGLSLDTSGITNGVQLIGTPTTTKPPSILRVTATASNTGAVAYKDVSFTILSDTITLSNVPASNLAFVQNRPIVPIQLRGTALSGREVTTFQGASMPTGVSVGATGLVTGVPSGSNSGTFSITASTDFTAQSGFLFPYTITPDTMIFPLSPTVYTYPAGSPVSINIDALAYSGKTASNYVFSGLSPTYGLTIGSNTGIISGTISSGVPPDDLLPITSNFTVKATAGSLVGTLPVNLTTFNAPFQRFYAIQDVGPPDVRFPTWQSAWLYANSTGDLSNLNTPGIFYPGFVSDYALRFAGTLDTTIVLCVTRVYEAAGSISRSFIDLPSSNISFGGAEGVTSNMRPYKAISVSNTNTWHVGGTVTGSDGNTYVSLFRSTDDAFTFSNLTPGGIGVAPRRSPLGSPDDRFTNYYTAYGTAFGYSNGVFLLGGTYDASLGPTASRLKRSTDGTTWTDVVGMFEAEVGNISTGGPVWVATGSSVYEAGVTSAVSTPADTLRYSTDQGQTWSNAMGTPHDVLGFDVAYASNIWLSSGLSRTGTNVISTLVCSRDGMNWSNVLLPVPFTVSAATPRLSEVASIFFDTTYSLWYAFVKLDSAASYIYTHPPFGDMTVDWTLLTSNTFPFDLWPGQEYPSRILGQRLVAEGPTSVRLTFATSTGAGPTITSPTTSAITLYQYVTIDPINVTASGSGAVYFFVTADELPTGISFDPATGIFSGVSVTVGKKAVTLYAKDNNGITAFSITFTTIQAFVVKKQSNASAWTSLVRQTATVGGAQNSVNGRVVPAAQAALGEFTRDEPPDSVTISNCPC